MEKKSNKVLWVVIGILITVVLLLITIVAILLFGRMSGKQGSVDYGDLFSVGNHKDVQSEGDASDILGEEITKNNEGTTNNSIIMIIDGFQFTVPGDYDCFYSYEVGPVVYLDDIFQMKTVVRPGIYEELVSNPESMMQKTVAAGGSILQEVKETEFGGKNYAYFRMELGGDKCFVIYTQAADTDNWIAGQIVMENDNLTDEDLLHVFASIASTAQVTDQADSTYDDIAAQMVARASDIGEKKEESTLYFAGESVTFCVPSGFYSQGGYESDSYSSESFWSEDYVVAADCYLLSDDISGDAESYIENERDNRFDSDEVKIQTTRIDGTTCYYIEAKYNYNGSEYQRIYAACDTGTEGIYYCVEANIVDGDVELSIETIKDFFVFSK